MKVHHVRLPLTVLGLVILAVALAIMMRQTFKREVPAVETPSQTTSNAIFKLSSPVFDADGAIPVTFTCNGDNINPPLSIENPPNNTKAFALIVHDPDGVSKDFV